MIVIALHCIAAGVVMAYLINSSKSRVDKFWSLHHFVYDYRA